MQQTLVDKPLGNGNGAVVDKAVVEKMIADKVVVDKAVVDKAIAEKPLVDSRAPLSIIGIAQPAVTLEMVHASPYIMAYIKRADEQMGVLGYTEHGERHASLVSRIAYNILVHLNYPERTAELAAIAGYLHDTGNLLHRVGHPMSGAMLALIELRQMGMDPAELAIIMGAIGNHEEDAGDPVSEVSAAIILADKSDVHRSRVRNPNTLAFDIHDRVNYAAQRSFVRVDNDHKTISAERRHRYQYLTSYGVLRNLP